MSEMIKEITFNKDKMLEMCNKGHINATDVADALVSELGVPFRDAHMITGKLVAIADKKQKQIHELNIRDFKKVDKRINKNIVNKFSKSTKSEIITMSTFEKEAISKIKAKLISYAS